MKNISTGTRIALLAAALFASVTAMADGCRGDTNGNGRVDGVDLAQVLADWGHVMDVQQMSIWMDW